MPLIHCNFFSQALGKASALYAVVPQSATPCPVVYLLHGLSDDYSIWQRRTGIERFADTLKIAVVMLDGGKSFYCDMASGDKYEQHILESIQTAEAILRIGGKRFLRGIGGLSMGGYGAVKMAMKHPEMFASAHSHSGVLDPTRFYRGKSLKELRADWVGGAMLQAFGEKIPAQEDTMKLAANFAKSKGPKPALHLDCGSEDFLIEDNRAFHARLEKLGVKHTYTEHPGSHDWGYWDQHVQTALRWHLTNFLVKP